MKFLQIHTFYQFYLETFNRKHSYIFNYNFDNHIAEIIKDVFQGGHIISPYMSEVGYESQLIVANWGEAQIKWLMENGYSTNIDNMHEIVKLQIDTLKPDIIYFTDPITFDSKFIRYLEWKPKFIIGWRAASILEGTDWSEFDLIISIFSHYREISRKLGAKNFEVFFPGFNSFIADKVKPVKKEFDIVFSGQYTIEHKERNKILLEVSKAPLGNRGSFSIGYFIASLSTDLLPAGISMYNQGDRGGIEMYKALKMGKIALNSHIDLAEDEGINMRTFEVTGVGSFLLTEFKENIGKYFKFDEEIVTFKDTKELIDKIYYYLAHPDEREEIALNGQKRCLKDYSMEVKANLLNELIRKYLSLKPNQQINNDIKKVMVNEERNNFFKSILVLIENNSWDEAIKALSENLKLNKYKYETFHLLAYCLEKLGQSNIAEQFYKQISKLSDGKEIKKDDIDLYFSDFSNSDINL